MTWACGHRDEKILDFPSEGGISEPQCEIFDFDSELARGVYLHEWKARMRRSVLTQDLQQLDGCDNFGFAVVKGSLKIIFVSNTDLLRQGCSALLKSAWEELSFHANSLIISALADVSCIALEGLSQEQALDPSLLTYNRTKAHNM